MRKLFFFICLFLGMTLSAQAASDIIATYKYSDGSMVTICTRDARNVRMDTSPTSYVLLKGDKVYSVSQDDEGQWNVMDMDQLKGMSGTTSMFGGSSSTPDYDVRYEKTGKTEKIAGYNGNIYTAVVFEDGQVVRRDEIVLCSHSNLKRLTEGWIALTSGMTGGNQAMDDSMAEAKKMGYGGMLRYGKEMRLKSLSVKNLDDAYYALPSGAQQVEVAVPQQQAAGGGLEDDAREIGEDAKDATKDEIKEGVRSLIGDLFN